MMKSADADVSHMHAGTSPIQVVEHVTTQWTPGLAAHCRETQKCINGSLESDEDSKEDATAWEDIIRAKPSIARKAPSEASSDDANLSVTDRVVEHRWETQLATADDSGESVDRMSTDESAEDLSSWAEMLKPKLPLPHQQIAPSECTSEADEPMSMLEEGFAPSLQWESEVVADDDLGVSVERDCFMAADDEPALQAPYSFDGGHPISTSPHQSALLQPTLSHCDLHDSASDAESSESEAVTALRHLDVESASSESDLESVHEKPDKSPIHMDEDSVPAEDHSDSTSVSSEPDSVALTSSAESSSDASDSESVSADDEAADASSGFSEADSVSVSGADGSSASYSSGSSCSSDEKDFRSPPVVEVIDSPVRTRRESKPLTGAIMLPTAVSIVTPDHKHRGGDSPMSPGRGYYSSSDSVVSTPVKKRSKVVVLMVESLHKDSGGPRLTAVGDQVRIRYSLFLPSQATCIYDRGELDFRIGKGEVLPGIDQGVVGMNQGDIRRITIPPELGYRDGFPGYSELSSTLLYEVEVLSIK